MFFGGLNDDPGLFPITRGNAFFALESVSQSEYSLPSAQSNHPQAIVVKIPKTEGPPGDYFHFRVQAFGNAVGFPVLLDAHGGHVESAALPDYPTEVVVSLVSRRR